MESRIQATIVDTDTLSEIFRGRNRVVASRADFHRTSFGPYAVSVVTVAEVVRGLQRVERSDRIDAFRGLLSELHVIGLDVEAAELAGRIAGDLDRTGETIGLADPLIAATAIRHNLVLATGNLRHYQRIIDLGYDLILDDWRQPTSA